MAVKELTSVSTTAPRSTLARIVPFRNQGGNSTCSVTLTDRVCEHVLEKISGGQMEPGAKIVELQIAEELQMSSVPVREAMSKLEQEGWVERIPNRGIFVKKLEMEDIREVFELREILEIAAVGKIAKTITKEQLDELQQLRGIVENARLTRDDETARKADIHFHRLLIHYVGNQRMARMFESILIQASGVLFRLADDYPAILKEVRKRQKVADHQQICAALEEHDTVKALKCIKDHVKIAYKTAVAVERVLGSLTCEDEAEDGYDSPDDLS